MDFNARLAAIDRGALTSPVRRILRREGAEVVEWRLQRLVGGMGEVWGSNNVCRLVGSANDAGDVLGWSLVLKVVPIPDPCVGDASGMHDPAHEEYWRREALTDESGILDQLPPGLSAPRCVGVVERDGCLWIWLEDLVDAIGPRWPLARFGVAARHLGQFNGAYLAGRPLPTYPWLNRDFLRSRADRNAAFWAQLDRVRNDPLFQIGWSGDIAPRALRLFQQRYRLLDTLDRLPVSLRHGDADRRNLFARDAPNRREETVAIDWAHLGIAGVGVDVANLVVQSVMWGKGVGPADLPGLDRVCTDEYLEGARDAGWRGDPRLARIGAVATMALQYGPLHGLASVVGIDAERRARLEHTFGQPIEEFLSRYAEIQRYVYQCFDEADDLLSLL